MKKTIILACAVLSASAMAATELGSFTLATTDANTASATLVGTSDLALTLDSVTVSPDQGNDYKHWTGMVVPNINVGNNTGTWTLTFTLTNNSSSAISFNEIALDVVGMTGNGGAQNAGGGVSVTEGETWVGATADNNGQGTNKPIDFTLTLGAYSATQTVNVVSTTADPVYTFDSPIELAANGGSVTFSVLADNNAAYTGGAFAGIKGVTVSVPEPATATLSLLALASLAARRRRK